MPVVKEAPEALNKRLEEVYSGCMSGKNSDKGVCSAVAWKQVKREGWHKANGVWKKSGSKRV